MTKTLTAIVNHENHGYVALCPELDIASQGDIIGQARDNLREALELFYETADSAEIRARRTARHKLHDPIIYARENSSG